MNPKPVDKIIPVGIILKDHPTLNASTNNMMQRTGGIYPRSSGHDNPLASESPFENCKTKGHP
jgi:hypothetical protein